MTHSAGLRAVATAFVAASLLAVMTRCGAGEGDATDIAGTPDAAAEAPGPDAVPADAVPADTTPADAEPDVLAPLFAHPHDGKLYAAAG